MPVKAKLGEFETLLSNRKAVEKLGFKQEDLLAQLREGVTFSALALGNRCAAGERRIAIGAGPETCAVASLRAIQELGAQQHRAVEVGILRRRP